MAAIYINIDPTSELVRIRAERARRDFMYFVRLVRPEYDIQWFHCVVGQELQRVGIATESARLGMAMPPGMAKSEYAILYCAWMIARDRDITIKYVTYNTTFAKKQFKRLKEILRTEEYVRHFGWAFNTRAAPKEIKLDEENSAERIELLGGAGWVDACGFNGGITGGRCDIIVIDDPFKNHEEAYSPTIREKRWSEYKASIKTRKRVGRPLRILMLFTRWHLDDLAGRCKNLESKRWRWIEFEAIKESVAANDDVERQDPREMGDLLWPDVFSREDLEEERQTAPGIFMAMYQQRPVPEGGALWKEAWVTNRYDVLPTGKGHFIQSWDFRGGGKGRKGNGEGTSWAVGLLFWKPKAEQRLYLVDVRRNRWSPDETLVEFERINRGTDELKDPRWVKAKTRLVELKADGVMVHAHFARKFSGMLGLKPHKDKGQRARDVAPFVRAGQLVLPEHAPWLATYMSEIFTFPGGVHDDQMDATTQALEEEFGVSAQVVEFEITPMIR